MGSKPARRVPNPPFLHAAERPAAPCNIDFNSLNLSYKLINEPKFTIPRIGWAPKPATIPQNLPFIVERAGPGEGLPVYTDYKAGRTKVITILKRIRGDVLSLRSEIEKVVGKNAEIKPGKIVIEGNYHKRLKLWLIGLGF